MEDELEFAVCLHTLLHHAASQFTVGYIPRIKRHPHNTVAS